MNQKLPVIVAALALLVVGGIWWEPRAPMGHDSIDVAQSVAAARPTPQHLGRTGADLRAKRDAWLAAREQRGMGDVRAEAAVRGSVQARGSGSVDVAPPPVAAPDRDRVTAAGAAAARRGAMVPEADFESLKEIALNDPDPEERINALWSVSLGDEAEALPVLTSALNDGDREVRLAAVQELGGLEDERGVVDALSVALTDSDAEIRAEAVRLIGDTEDPRVAELARHLLNDPDPDVRDEAQGVIESVTE